MLYIVATPLGNLQDITLRALEALKSTRLIIAENPSHSKRLLDHFGIADKKIVQFAEHNEQFMLDNLTKRLAGNEDACLISDAGTPGISDPGFRLVRACVEQGIPVTPLPGPSAEVAALSASGLPSDKYWYVGFLPKTEPKLLKILEQAQIIGSTVIAFESPVRIRKTVQAIAAAYPQAKIVIARELTKIHEEFIRGIALEVQQELEKRVSIKGEVTLLISFK